MTTETSAIKAETTDTQRAEFCEYLREHRDKTSMSLSDIATKTRIPLRSLEFLEAGRFEDLPADVFVRGFLRSYAKCIGVDAEDAVRRYAKVGLAPAPVAAGTAEELVPSPEAAAPQIEVEDGAGLRHKSARVAAEWIDVLRPQRRLARGTSAEEVITEAQVGPDAEAAAETTGSRMRDLLPAGFRDVDDEGNRGSLTMAVILLVIVATLTMSYLLRRPSNVGDGITAAPTMVEFRTV